MHDLREGETPPQEAELSVGILQCVEERQNLIHLGDLGPQSDLHVAWVADRCTDKVMLI